MSQENVQLVRRTLGAYLRGDLKQVLSYVDADAELHSAIIGGAEGRNYRGHDGFRAWYAETYETFEEVGIDVNEYRDLGDRVLVLGHMRARGRESGAEVDSPTGWLYVFNDGKVVKVWGFLDHGKALEAAGLSE
jgi:ketosteroid isomerase-like protein